MAKRSATPDHASSANEFISERRRSQTAEESPAKGQKIAGPCPDSKNHRNTRVYRTVGRIRYCVCDDCGTTWKRSLHAA